MNLKEYAIKNTGAATFMTKYALDNWNRHIDIDSETYTDGELEDTYGWQPMDAGMINELITQHKTDNLVLLDNIQPVKFAHLLSHFSDGDLIKEIERRGYNVEHLKI